MVAGIAKGFNAEIILLHVVEMGRHDSAYSLDQAKAYEYFERVRSKLCEQWQLPEEYEAIRTEKIVRHHIGSAGYGIRQLAQDWDVDLIAMATHGRSGLPKVLLGSVTEKLIRIADCPVLSVRSKLQADGDPDKSSAE